MDEETTSKAALQEKLQRLKEQRNGVSRKISELRKHYGLILTQITETENAIKRLKTDPYVSDHALLRYLHRQLGIDLDEVREQMLGSGVREAIKMGAEKITREGYQYMISKEGCITTVIGPDRSAEGRK